MSWTHRNLDFGRDMRANQRRIYRILVGCIAVYLIGRYLSSILAQSVTMKHLKFDQKNHRSRSLRTERLKKVAQMSDNTHMTYFKDNLLRPLLTVRVSGTPENKKVQQHIIKTMEDLGWHIEEDQFTSPTPFGDKEFNNIITTQNPSAPRKLTLACHFDSKYYKNMKFIGATDSAVPCAMLLDLARSMREAFKTSKASDISLQFIFFDGEEAFKDWTDTDSIYGARHLASRMEQETLFVEREVKVNKLATMDVMILLDLIGHHNTVFRNWFSDTAPLFERMAKIEMKLIKEGELVPAQDFKNRKSNKYFLGKSLMGGMIQDDHIPFLNKNVRVVHLISYPFPDVWHKAGDDESALDYDTINNIGKILRVFVSEYLHLSP